MQTMEEFNDKYKQYLSSGHYGLDINDEGVVQLLDKLFDIYLSKIEGFVYQQIKMTGDGSVVFLSSLDEDIDPKAEALVSLIETTIKTLYSIQALQDTLKGVSNIVSKKLQELN